MRSRSGFVLDVADLTLGNGAELFLAERLPICGPDELVEGPLGSTSLRIVFSTTEDGTCPLRNPGSLTRAASSPVSRCRSELTTPEGNRGRSWSRRQRSPSSTEIWSWVSLDGHLRSFSAYIGRS